MRIAISTNPLSNGHTGRGVGVYTASLIQALKKQKDIEIVEFRNVRELPDSVDLIHFTYFDPFFLTLPWRLSKPFVVTVHDMIPFVFPKRFPSGFRGAVKWYIQKWRLSAAKGVLTDSISSKKDIEKFVPGLKNRIDVVYLAQNDVFNHALTIDGAKRIIKAYSLSERFVVYVGDVNWNKNIPGLLRAWHILDRDGLLKSGEKLYLLGGAFMHNSREQKAIQDMITQYRLESSVICVGRVKEADLPIFLSLSTLCVFPSFYEGFGLPVLEAMASGTIVVTTKGGSLGEIAGPAFTCDPSDDKSIAEAIVHAMVLDPRRREALIKDGIAWAKKFNWDTVAQETIAVYNKAISARHI